MSSHAHTSEPGAPLDLSPWRKVPMILIAVGAVIGAAAFALGGPEMKRQFAYSYLLAYIYFLSICAGCLFLVLVHHLFDASWSVPLRRLAEHGACLLSPGMGLLFLPIALMAMFGGAGLNFYPWMEMDPHSQHALHAKQALLNKSVWLGASIAIFVVWWLLAHGLRSWSLKQDETGSAECTHKMRSYSYWGIFAFAVSLTLAIILWVKSLEHEWFSTMYGVYYFAESVWTTLATLYVLMVVLYRTGHLKGVITRQTRHDLGVLWFAFTVFYAYIHFSQYFIIWNANVPEETWRYILREQGAWWEVGLLIIFGHFFVPFLALLRIDVKVNPTLMIGIAVWAWLMHFFDVAFNVTPILHPKGDIVLHGLDFACMAFIGGILALLWIKSFNRHSPYPKKDPRLGEAIGAWGHHPTTTYSVAPSGGK